MPQPSRLLWLGLDCFADWSYCAGFFNSGVPSPWNKISHEVPSAPSCDVLDDESKELDKLFPVKAIAGSVLKASTSLSRSRVMRRSNTFV